MPNLTTVTLTNGAGTGGTGTVSTLDNVVGVAGTPSAQVQTVQGVTSMTPLKVDGSAVTQPVSAASLPLPTGAATSANQPTNAAIASTTAGQTGTLIQGAVTTAAPSYTTLQTSPLSLDTGGSLRITATGGSVFAKLQTNSGNGADTGSGASSANTIRVIPATDTTVNPTTPANWGIGTSTQNSASVANAQLTLGQFNTTPTTITTGNTSPLQMDNAGNLLVNIKAGAGSGGTALADSATFTEGTTSFTPIGGVFKTSQTALTTGQGGAVALSAAREMNSLGKVWDGTNTANVKAASTAPVATDPALVVAISPNSVNPNGRALPSASAPVVLNSMTYKAVAASASATLFGATGATGDYLDGVLIIPATSAAGAVSITDGSGSAITIFAGGGTTALPTLAPFFVPIGAVSSGGAGGWKVTTGTNVSVIGVGNFT